MHFSSILKHHSIFELILRILACQKAEDSLMLIVRSDLIYRQLIQRRSIHRTTGTQRTKNPKQNKRQWLKTKQLPNVK